MDTLVRSLIYALGIIGVTGVLIFVLALCYQLLKVVDRVLPRIWLVAGFVMAAAGAGIEYLGLTAVALLVCTTGLLLLAIGMLLWWIERRERLEQDERPPHRVAPRL